MDIEIIHEKRTGCLSISYTTSVQPYLELIESVYEARGGIEGQRSPLKTKTGIRIRNRMIEDIRNGAILPPIVLGATLEAEEFDKAQTLTTGEDLVAFLKDLDSDSISIIDGMQRTTAILAANDEDKINDNPLRVELWLARSINKLIYRMLVLNTGQVPWDMKRQLVTIYQPILKEIKKEVPDIEVLLLDDGSRRAQSGQYQSSKLIEYFLAFSSRKVNVDIKEKVAEDFARMEASEATSDDDFIDNFILSLKVLYSLDQVFDKCKKDNDLEGKFKSGKDIFTSSPAGIGFMASAAVFIYGRPGFPNIPQKKQESLDGLKTKTQALIDMLNSKSPEDMQNFLDLIGLNEKLSRRSGKVGEFEREFFFRAFSVIFESGDTLTSMEPCWSAY